MRTYTIIRTVYKYEELSDTAKQKVLEILADVNVDHEWYDGTYDDAATIGLNIVEFDLERGRTCKGLWTMDALDVAEAIIKNHGDACETYVDAMSFVQDYAKAQMEYEISNKSDLLDNSSDILMFEEADTAVAMSEEFQQVIREDYWKLLEEEYEYLTSEEVILEAIESNDYEFTAEGRIDGGN